MRSRNPCPLGHGSSMKEILMFKTIEFMSRSNIHYLPAQSNSIIISIANPNMENANIAEGFKDILFLNFDNVDRLMSGCIRFGTSHANSILEFIDKYENDDTVDTIFINCIQGESRSAAVAHYLSLLYDIALKQKTDDKLFWIYEVLETTRETGKLDF